MKFYDSQISVDAEPRAIVAEVLRMRTQMVLQGNYGPYELQVTREHTLIVALDCDYDVNSNLPPHATLRDRLKRIDSIDQVTFTRTTRDEPTLRLVQL